MRPQHIIGIDFETYFDNEYTLKKMSTEAYIRDPRFEVHGAAIVSTDPDWNLGWLRDEELYNALRAIPWDKYACLAHHAQFDGLILSHHFGCFPAFWYDTLPMGRMLVGQHVSASLDSLSQYFNLGAKNVPYEWFRGRHWDQITSDVQEQIAAGCENDINLTYKLLQELLAYFPQDELLLVSDTVKMFTEPRLIGNTARLAQVADDEMNRKQALLDNLQVTGKDLRSNEKFAAMLREQGVEPGMKASDTPNADSSIKYIYAFAKTDDFMRDLVDGEDEELSLLAEARLSEKSNIEQSRSQRLRHMSERGAMCVYLNTYGAHTLRWSGGDSVNWQNRKRDSKINVCIEAGPGEAIVVADASQIECRILNYVAGQDDVVECFRRKEDPYVNLATIFYGEQIYKPKGDDPRKAEMEQKRGTGKQGELSCGYGAGGPTIKATAKKGTYGPPVYMTDDEALVLRDVYRQTHPAVVALWKEANEVLKHMHAGRKFDWRVLHIKDKVIYLPNGAPLIYQTLEWCTDNGEPYWRVRTRRNGWTKMYGAKLVENIIQALARLATSQAWIRCSEAGIRIVSMEHDKLFGLIQQHEAEAALSFMQQEMSRAPWWLPSIPLDSEGYISNTFAKG